MKPRNTLALLPLLLCVATPTSAQDSAPKSWSFRTLDGGEFGPRRLAESKATVLAWSGLDCPMSKVYLPRLDAIAKEYTDRGVRFCIVHSNVQDELERVRDRAKTVRAPIAYDRGGRVARHFDAKRTTEVLVLDARGAIRYRGAVDDQYGYRKSETGGIGTYRKDAPSAHYLRDALDALLAGKSVATESTDPMGCALGLRWDAPIDAPPDAPTFHRDVEPILHARCTKCHRDHTPAPFALRTYEDALGWADMIREVVTDKRMPPWAANPAHGDFVNDPRLTEEQIRTIQHWVDADCPRGDPDDAPPPQNWVEGWQIGEPDVVLSAPAHTVPAEGRLDYRYVRVRTQFEEDRWIEAAQIRSTGNEVVHHVLAFMLPPRGRNAPVDAPWTPKWHVTDLFADVRGEKQRFHMLRTQKYLRDFRFAGGGVFGFLFAQLPGDDALDHEPGRATYLPAGATIVFQIHYTPNGTETESVTQIGLKFAKEPPREVRHVHAMTSVTFEIPPREASHEVVVRHRFQRGGKLLSVLPHMHLRGKSFRYELVRRDGSREILLDVPRFDFDWQTQYVLKEPIRFERGERIVGTAVFDNSADNPHNPDPDETVYFGLQTDEEMLIGYFEAVWDQD